MASVILWMCPCGTHFKAVHTGSGRSIVRCSNLTCPSTYLISGIIDSLFVEDADGHWEPVLKEPLSISTIETVTAAEHNP